MRLWKLPVALALVVALGAAYASLASGQTTPACNDNWANSSVTSGDWATSANWTNGVPGTTAGVNDVPCWPSTVTVTVSTGTQTALAVEGGTLTVDGGSLSITDSSDDSALGALNISGGTLNGDSPLTLSGNFDWSAQATLGDSGSNAIDITQTAGTFSISGSGQNYYQGGSISTSSPVSITALDFVATNSPTLTTSSTVTFGSGSYSQNGAGALTISAAGFVTSGGTSSTATLADYLLHLTGNSSSIGGNLVTPELNTDASTTLTIPSGYTVTSDDGMINGKITGAGTFSESTGTSEFTSGSTLSSDDVSLPGGEIEMDSGSTYAVGSGTGQGTTISSGTLLLNNTSSSTGDLTLNQTGSTLEGNSALSVTGNFSWSAQATVGGAGASAVDITQTGTGTFSITGSGQNYFSGGSISTGSPVSITDLHLIAQGTSTLTTTSTVTFAPGSYDVNGSPSLGLTATGFITTGATTLPNYALTLSGNSSSIGGNLTTPVLNTNASTTLTIPSGYTVTSGGGTISGKITGAGEFAATAGTTTIASGGDLGTDNVGVPGGTLIAASGSTYAAGSGAGQGTTVSSGTLELNNASSSTGDLTLNQAGTVLEGGSALSVTGNFNWTASATLGGAGSDAVDITQTGSGSFSISGNGQAYFQGGSLSTSSPVSISDLDFIATGTPTLTTTGTVTFAPGSYSQNGGASLGISAAGFITTGDTSLPNYNLTQTGGTTDIPSGTDLSAASLGVSGGTLQVDGTLGSESNTPVTLTGGILGGTGTVDGSVTNTSGQVTPGDEAPGTLNVHGTYTQGATGTLGIPVSEATIGGASALNVTGSVSLGGLLLMLPVGTYATAASPGDEFAVVQFTSGLTGSFTVSSSPALHSGETFSEVNTAGTVEALVGAAQPPVNSGAPVVSGNTVVGDQLSTTNGTWTNDPTSFTYQWEDCTSAAATSCSDVASGGTTSKYTLQSSDAGKYVTVVVTAHNAASTAGTATGAPVKGPVTNPAPPPPTAPKNTAAPSISGTPASGKALACSTGSWNPAATGYTYSWAADGTQIVGATSGSYTVQQTDEGLTITCTVVASNTGGSSSPVTSAGIKIPIPVIKGCPAATGTLGGTTLGLIHLGMTRAQARHAFTKSTDRGQKYIDFFCLTPRGVRVGYASPKLLKTLPKSKRGKLAGRVIWASTSNGYYNVKGIRPGATLTAAKAALPGGNYFRVGANYWYLAANGADTAVLKLRGGVVQEIGIGNKSLTKGLKAQKTFMTSFE